MANKLNVLGQGSVLQARVSSGSPSHAGPPSSGAGLRQVRVLVWVPPPHSAEHADHRSNSLHPAELRCCATIDIILLCSLYCCSVWFIISTLTDKTISRDNVVIKCAIGR